MVGGGGTEWNGVELERVPEGESGLLRGIRGDVEIDNAIPRLPLPPTTGPTRTPVSRSTALLSFSFFHSIFFFFFFTFSFISRFSSLRVAVFFFCFYAAAVSPGATPSATTARAKRTPSFRNVNSINARLFRLVQKPCLEKEKKSIVA